MIYTKKYTYITYILIYIYNILLAEFIYTKSNILIYAIYQINY